MELTNTNDFSFRTDENYLKLSQALADSRETSRNIEWEIEQEFGDVAANEAVAES